MSLSFHAMWRLRQRVCHGSRFLLRFSHCCKLRGAQSSRVAARELLIPIMYHVGLTPDQEQRLGSTGRCRRGKREAPLVHQSQTADLGCPTVPLRQATADFAALNGRHACAEPREGPPALHLPVSGRPPDSAFPSRIPEGCRRSAAVARSTFVLDRLRVSPRLFAATDRITHDGYRLLLSRSTGGAPQPEERPPHDAGHLHVSEGGLPIPMTRRRSPSPFLDACSPCIAPAGRTDAPSVHRNSAAPAECFVSLSAPTVVCPAVDGVIAEKSLEVRFFCRWQAGLQPRLR